MRQSGQQVKLPTSEALIYGRGASVWLTWRAVEMLLRKVLSRLQARPPTFGGRYTEDGITLCCARADERLANAICRRYISGFR
jgi:hypothetical protein